jgi:transposase
MAKPILSDDLWVRIEPLIPKEPDRHHLYAGRKPIDARRVLTGILFVLRTGMPWEDLPQEMGCGSGMTCWRRLRDWQKAGVWQRLFENLLSELESLGALDWSRALVDSAQVRAPHGGKKTGPSPVDRRKTGSKHHILTDAQGIPLSTRLTKANRHDVTQILKLVRDIPQVKRGGRGRPRHRPDRVQGDRAYDSRAVRQALKKTA